MIPIILENFLQNDEDLIYASGDESVTTTDSWNATTSSWNTTASSSNQTAATAPQPVEPKFVTSEIIIFKPIKSGVFLDPNSLAHKNQL